MGVNVFRMVVAEAAKARFRELGHRTIDVDGVSHAVDGWVGSQNHNWGRKHTDRYAWGQVAGFDDAPGSFLEQVQVMQCTLAGGDSTAFTPATSKILDVDERDEDTIPFTDPGRNLGGRTGGEGEEAYLEREADRSAALPCQ